jgi:hypothetical protein
MEGNSMYAFKRETVKHTLVVQFATAGEEREIALDPAILAAPPKAALVVTVGGTEVEFDRTEDGQWIALKQPVEPGTPVKIEVQCVVILREAGRLQGFRRQDEARAAVEWLEAQGYKVDTQEDVKKVPPETWKLFMLVRFERSAALGAAEHIRGVPEEWLTMEGFAEMPEAFELEWVNAAYRLNPHWDRIYRLGLGGGEPEAEKKG